jgi:hypothetical protein
MIIVVADWSVRRRSNTSRNLYHPALRVFRNQVKIGDHCSSSSAARRKRTARFPDGQPRISYKVSFIFVLFL